MPVGDPRNQVTMAQRLPVASGGPACAPEQVARSSRAGPIPEHLPRLPPGNVPRDRRARQAQPLELIPQPLDVLLHPVLDHLRPVPDVA
jgi:hypothetical protein